METYDKNGKLVTYTIEEDEDYSELEMLEDDDEFDEEEDVVEDT